MKNKLLLEKASRAVHMAKESGSWPVIVKKENLQTIRNYISVMSFYAGISVSTSYDNEEGLLSVNLREDEDDA